VYQKYFGFSERPFSETPNPKFFYLSSRHREGLAHLEFNIRDGKGFTVLVGEVGTGKTTLCRALIDRLDKEKTIVAHVIHTNLDFHEFLREVIDELGIPVQGQQKWDLLKALNQFLIEAYGQNRKVVLIVDEAQNLTPSVLEGIRMLSNLETPQEKLIQIIFVGQPGLMKHILRPDMVQLKQRIAGSYFLGPLSQKETQEYVTFRMSHAQDKPSLRFTPEAVNLIHDLSSGVPRLINFLCDFSLIHAYVEETWTIDPLLVQKAYKDLKGSSDADESKEGKEKKFQSKFYGGNGENVGLSNIPRKIQIPEMQIGDCDLEESPPESGGENFFFQEKKSIRKKMVMALCLLLTLGGIGSYFFWEMTTEQWSPKPVPSAYHIKMPVADPGKDLQSRPHMYQKKLSKVTQEPSD